ncbi:nuclear receptor coactivator 7 isoform X2 [Chanos chanos]|uniref:Nuclear receptor coactivator 7 isoform X2 n=1 Tax=Chanos chanos TaxID=29144 RepID=A0A6J2V5N4_CHACN|nr:nuclear receptor coactivator 7-like isoform X2 [Chanos chanos]
MEKREKRPGYFARLKKKRQIKHSQSEKLVIEQNQSAVVSKESVICAPASTVEIQEKNVEKETLRKNSQIQNEKAEESCNSSSQTKKEKRRPPGTVEYTVGPNDTLNSIALKFNITPNKLVQLNRLYSRSVVPGQRLFVPDVGQSESGSQVTGSSDQAATESSEKESQDGEMSNRAGKPLRRQMSPLSEDEGPATVKFIKMSCKYFTDGMGVVGGVMIVTPNNIMFDPHKSDPLVIEHGCEEYGLICPMEEVLSVALYDDVSRMKLKDALPSPGEWEELPSERDLNPFSRYEAMPSRPIILDEAEFEAGECRPSDKSPSDEGFTELEMLQNDSGAESANSDAKQSQVPPHGPTGHELKEATQQYQSNIAEQRGKKKESFSEVLPEKEIKREEKEEDEGLNNNHASEESPEVLLIPVSADAEPASAMQAGVRSGDGEHPVAKDVNAAKEDREASGLESEISETTSASGDQKGKLSLGGMAGDSGKCSPSGQNPDEAVETSEPNSEEELTEEEKRRRANEAEMKSWLLKRMQAPIEDMLLSTEEKSKTPPMFLCFKVGKPMKKSFAIGQTSSPAHSFGGRGKQLEYWFAVPQERVDHLYSFFIQWSPDVYGKDAQEQGFVVVEKDELDMIDNFFSDPVPRSWEIITINEAKRRQSFGSFEDEESMDVLPVLSDSSALMEDTHVEKLAARLPARVQGYPWRLVYSTVVHGTSLKTMYRNLSELECPVLLVIKDMDNQLFGAFSTHPFRVSEHYYGTGEAFLYTFNPEIKVFRWTGENSYFVKGNLDSLQMGGGGGQIGLWLDADLYHGTTSKCSTFNNQPLSSQQDFTVQNLEVWAFE